MPSFHEDLGRSEVAEGPSERSFGLTVGGILVLIAAWRAWPDGPAAIEVVLGLVALGLIGCGLLWPPALAPFNRAWMRLGILLSKVVSPVALFLVYATTVVPIGLLRRALGHDPLRLKFDPDADSYWINKEPPGPAPETMTNQF